MSEESRAEKAKKLKHTLIPVETLEAVLRVLSYGAAKHGERDYLNYSDENLLDASYRHLAEVRKGDAPDAETGESHWAHVAANAIMALDIHITNKKGRQ